MRYRLILWSLNLTYQILCSTKTCSSTSNVIRGMRQELVKQYILRDETHTYTHPLTDIPKKYKATVIH